MQVSEKDYSNAIKVRSDVVLIGTVPRMGFTFEPLEHHPKSNHLVSSILSFIYSNENGITVKREKTNYLIFIVIMRIFAENAVNLRQVV